jgi:hypothetical protein
MAHYAFLNEENIVTEVIVGKDENEGVIDWESHYGGIRGQVCKRTSYNTAGNLHNSEGTAFRKNYAGIGYTYDISNDAFIPFKHFNSWVLNQDTYLWEAPVEKPNDGQEYIWNEETTSWELITS